MIFVLVRMFELTECSVRVVWLLSQNIFEVEASFTNLRVPTFPYV